MSVTSQVGTIVEWRLTRAPSGSSLQVGTLRDVSGDFGQSFKPDVPGVYSFDALDWTRSSVTARYDGDAQAAPTQTLNGTTSTTIEVAAAFTRALGASPHVVDVQFVARGGSVAAAILRNARTSAAETAMRSEAVIRALWAMYGSATSSMDSALTAKVNSLRTKYEAHRALTSGGVHGAADTLNTVTLNRDTSTLDGAIAAINELRAKLSSHVVNVASSVHAHADTTNVVTAPAATDVVSAHTLADQMWTVYEAHRQLVGSSAVHGAADSTNTLTAQGSLAALDSAFIAACVNPSFTAPPGVDQAEADLVNAHGFRRS